MHQTRTVPTDARELSRDRIENARSDTYLFPSPTGAIWTNTNFRLRSRWTETTRPVGLAGTTIHDLRHAAPLLAAGAGVKAIQMTLGHATPTMTLELYGHLCSEAPWVAMETPVFPSQELTLISSRLSNSALLSPRRAPVPQHRALGEERP